MQAQADGHTHPVLWLQAGIQRCHGVHHGQPGAHRPLGGIFVRLRIAKVDQQTIAQVLRHVAVKGLHRRHRGLLIGPHHGAVVFWIKLLGEFCRVDQVAEQHRQLAAFGVRGRWGGGEGTQGLAGVRRECRLGVQSLTTPHQHSAALIHG